MPTHARFGQRVFRLVIAGAVLLAALPTSPTPVAQATSFEIAQGAGAKAPPEAPASAADPASP